MAFPLINVKFILLTAASFIAIFSSIAIYFCLPILISHLIRTQVTLSTTSGSFNDWRLNSVTDRIYLFNITNLSDLHNDSTLNGSYKVDKPRTIPKLKQIGPIAFRQDREKLNIRFDLTNETVIYDQKKSWTFLPELSLFKSVDELKSSWINHINVPLAGTTLNPEYGEFIDPIVAENDLRLFMNHSIDTMLFEGYFDILMEQAKVNGQIDFDKFGWMHGQNNTILKSIRVFTGPSNATLDKFGLVDEYGYTRHLSIWRDMNSNSSNFSNTKCNQIRLSSAGEFFPPPEYSIVGHNNYYKYTQHQQLMKQQLQDHQISLKSDKKETHHVNISKISNTSANEMELSTSNNNAPISDKQEDKLSTKLNMDETKRGKSISLFMAELCRTVRLDYNGSYYFKDQLLVDRYIATEKTYMYTSNNLEIPLSDSIIESNGCFCGFYNETTGLSRCPPNGMMDLFPCRKGSPISISFPHFLYSTNDKSLKPYLRLFEDDVKPNEKEHQFFIDLESTLNVPVNVQIVLQFNVHFRNDNVMNFTKEYAHLFMDPSGDSSQQPLSDLYLPQMWVKSTAEVDDKNLVNLKFIQNNLQLVTPITTIIMFSLASILLMASAKLAYDLCYGPQSARKSSNGDASCSTLVASGSCVNPVDKKKYFDMKTLGLDEKATKKSAFHFASMGNIAKVSSCNKTVSTSQLDYDELNRPTTSKKSSSFVITSESDSQQDCESQPLNR